MSNHPTATPDMAPESVAQNKSEKWAWFHTLRRHPIFPVLVFILASKVIGEFYPISPFSMYSNPTSRPLRYCYVADGSGKAIPIHFHTSISPSRITKMQRHNRTEVEEAHDLAMKKGEADTPLTDAEIRRQAGLIVLNYLVDASVKKKKEEKLLTGKDLQLVEVAISIEGGQLIETPVVVAELPASK